MAKLEQERTDGEISRLIRTVLAKAEGGAKFPATIEAVASEPWQHRSRYGTELNTDVNHSLAWLLIVLPSKDAARLFGERLLKLRDLAAYGWKEEAQIVLDVGHIEDQLELAQVAPRSQGATPVRWKALAKRIDGDIFRVAFSADGKELRTEHDDGVISRWNAATGKLIHRFDGPLPKSIPKGNPNQQYAWIAEDGSRWTFQRSGPTAYEIYVAGKNAAKTSIPATPPGDADSGEKANKPPGELRGRLELKWRQHEPLGLAPGGAYLFVGSHVFARRDLKLVSATNVSGKVERVAFSADGSRYALVTRIEEQDRARRVSADDEDEEESTSCLLRVHETRTGKTLFFAPRSREARVIHFSPDQRRVAVVNDRQEVEVWPLGRSF